MKTSHAPAVTPAAWRTIAASVVTQLKVPDWAGGIDSAASPAAATGVFLGGPDSEEAGEER